MSIGKLSYKRLAKDHRQLVPFHLSQRRVGRTSLHAVWPIVESLPACVSADPYKLRQQSLASAISRIDRAWRTGHCRLDMRTLTALDGPLPIDGMVNAEPARPHRRKMHVLPCDSPERLRLPQGRSRLSWSESTRRPWTCRCTDWKWNDDAQNIGQHMAALLDIAEDLNSVHQLTAETVGERCGPIYPHRLGTTKFPGPAKTGGNLPPTFIKCFIHRQVK